MTQQKQTEVRRRFDRTQSRPGRFAAHFSSALRGVWSPHARSSFMNMSLADVSVQHPFAAFVSQSVCGSDAGIIANATAGWGAAPRMCGNPSPNMLRRCKEMPARQATTIAGVRLERSRCNDGRSGSRCTSCQATLVGATPATMFSHVISARRTAAAMSGATDAVEAILSEGVPVVPLHGSEHACTCPCEFKRAWAC